MMHVRFFGFFCSCHVATAVRLIAPTAHQSERDANQCPGSSVSCSGNECCPGYAGTYGLTIPCPDADPGWNECEAKVVLNAPCAEDAVTCPGTSLACSGNVCCPGFNGSNGSTFPCPNADEGWNECELNREAPVVSAVGDPHVTSLSGETFDLWQTGWSKFVQIPPDAEEWNTKFAVSGNVLAYDSEDKCAASFLQDVRLSGSWLEQNLVLVRGGSLESSAPFAVSVNGSAFQQIDTSSGTEFVSRPTFRLWGEIRSDEPEKWGPDARFTATVGHLTVEITQHTEGRWEQSRSMLDLNVTGLDHLVDAVGGWLGIDGRSLAGDPPQGCSTMNLRHVKALTPGRSSPVTGFRSSHG